MTQAVRPAEIAWYVTGRFYVSLSDSAIQDVGYFIHLQNVIGDLFEGREIHESKAHFTFASTPFQARNIQNGDLKIGIDPVGEFSIFYNAKPRATFDDPASFAAGECIATFRRVSIVAGVTVDSFVTTNVFSSVVVWSKTFEHAKHRYDFRDLFPHGVTQFGDASASPLQPAMINYAAVIPFVGSAIAVG